MRMRKLLVLGILGLMCAGASARTLLIDVRTPAEYAAGHLDGALNIDHQVIAQRIGMTGASKDDELILYCRSGHRAGIALETLSGMGYKKVVNYGGMEEARQRLPQK